MSKNPFPSEVKLRVLKLANSGKSITEICSITKIPESSVRKLLKEFGVSAKHGSSRKIEISAKAEFIRLYTEEGMNPAVIARKCGVSETSVRKTIRAYEKRVKEGIESDELTLPIEPVTETTEKASTATHDPDAVSYRSIDVFDEIHTVANIRKLNTIQKHDILNDVYSYDAVGCGGANHVYIIHPFGDNPMEVGEHECLAIIQFQHGQRNDDTSNRGVLDTDLLEIVRDRLASFQSGDYACAENANALRHIEEALLWMNKRVEERAERGVLGTNNI